MNTTPSPQPTLLLNLNEVATQLRWTRRSVEKQIAQRRLRAVHLGRSVWVERTELDRFIASMRDADGG
jgi:excisionase family DNA binding protein